MALQRDVDAVGLKQVRAGLTGFTGIAQFFEGEPALVRLELVRLLVDDRIAHPVPEPVEDAAILGDTGLHGLLELVSPRRLRATVLGLEVALRSLQGWTEPNLGLTPAGLLPSGQNNLAAGSVHEEDDDTFTVLLDQRLGPPLDLTSATEHRDQETREPPEGAILTAVDALEPVVPPGAQPPPEERPPLYRERTCSPLLRQPVNPVHEDSVQEIQNVKHYYTRGHTGCEAQ